MMQTEMCFTISKCFLWISILFCLVQATKREFRCSVILEDKDSADNEIGLVHILADGATDTIHFLWSTYELPSVIIARTTNDTELSVNVTKLKTFEKDAIAFSAPPLESIGLTFSELWQMTYDKDSSDVKNVCGIEGLDFQSFKWTNISSSLNCSKSFASASLNAHRDDDLFSKNGAVEIQFSAAGNEIASTEHPHLIFNGNSTQLKIVLDHLYSNSTRTRYGLQIMLFSFPSKECHKVWTKAVSTSVNDENSPGVFSDIELCPQCSNGQPDSFVTWRPVAYTGKVPIVANSSDAQMMTDCKPIATTIPKSIAELYFDGKSEFSAFNMSFGTAGDGFYTKAEYMSWALMIGTGFPVKVKISVTAIIFMTAGLGALVFTFIGGGVFMACRHWNKKDDDLLLNEGSIN